MRGRIGYLPGRARNQTVQNMRMANCVDFLTSSRTYEAAFDRLKVGATVEPALLSSQRNIHALALRLIFQAPRALPT